MLESIFGNNYYSDDRTLRRLKLRIKFMLDHTQPDTPEHDRLVDEAGKAFDLVKKYKESGMPVKADTIATLSVVSALVLVVICLSQENPTILKLAQFVIKLFKF